MSNSYIIWGSSGHSKVLADIIYAGCCDVVALFDGNELAKASLQNVPIFYGDSGFNFWLINNSALIKKVFGALAIGGSKGLDRQNILEKFKMAGINCPPIIHSSAVVSDAASIGVGSQILANAVVAAGSEIGDVVIVNNSANIDHECRLANGVHVAPGATLCGCVTVLENSMIGAGAIVLPRLTIGKNSIVGAGAIVTRDVPDNSVVYGNRARIFGA